MQQVVMLWRIEKKLFCDIIWINSLINDISGSLSSLLTTRTISCYSAITIAGNKREEISAGS